MNTRGTRDENYACGGLERSAYGAGLAWHIQAFVEHILSFWISIHCTYEMI